MRAQAPEELRQQLLSDEPEQVLDARYRALLDYALKLTMTPAACCREDVDALREAGANDEEIHATVQVAAYFNYINRVADALGVDLEPEMQT
ncbi:MAG: carboxymuconolactone decarboxylase family protein [Planctomycetota bacterium]